MVGVEPMGGAPSLAASSHDDASGARESSACCDLSDLG